MSIDQSVLDKFEAVVESQRKRIMDMKAQDDFIDYSKLDKLIIGVRRRRHRPDDHRHGAART